MAAGHDHRARAQVALVGLEHDEVVLPRDLVRRGLEVDGHVELAERLGAQLGDEVLGEDPRVPGHVEDPLLRIQRGELAAELGQRVDDREDASRMPAQNAVVRPTGPAPMIVMSRTSSKSGCRVMRGGERASGRGAPSSAERARSTEVDTQVKVGVSRFV